MCILSIYTADFTGGGRQEQVKILFPYLENLPADHRIECDGDEWYVIVPASENWTIAVNRNTWNENTLDDVKGEEIARISDGLPFLLKCNISDLHSNVSLQRRMGTDRRAGVRSTICMQERFSETRILLR